MYTVKSILTSKSLSVVSPKPLARTWTYNWESTVLITIADFANFVAVIAYVSFTCQNGWNGCWADKFASFSGF